MLTNNEYNIGDGVDITIELDKQLTNISEKNKILYFME
jgi:hypothetical protein